MGVPTNFYDENGVLAVRASGQVRILPDIEVFGQEAGRVELFSAIDPRKVDFRLLTSPKHPCMLIEQVIIRGVGWQRRLAGRRSTACRFGTFRLERHGLLRVDARLASYSDALKLKNPKIRSLGGVSI